jgi:1A family penicillin-binding protein
MAFSNKRRRFTGIIFLLISILGMGYFAYSWLFRDLPDSVNLSKFFNIPSVKITDRQGRLLYEVLEENSGRHSIVPINEIPKDLQNATIATEDSSFYTNPGVDLKGIFRAVWINLRGGETLAGGSTITQQVARNLLLSSEERSERTVWRKLRESFLAWRLARYYTKEQILEIYLNQIYYGGLAYGVDAASQTFFGKPVGELDLAECALLAGLPQAPALYNPFTDPDASKKRQEVVLELMEKQGYISIDEQDLAKREPLIFAETPYPIEAPHFVMSVRAQMDDLVTRQEIYDSGGLIIRTTLDLDRQHLAERAISRQMTALHESDGSLGHNVNSAALVALDPNSGEVLAMVGSPDYFNASIGGAINMAISPRQPGSALKPILYAAAMDPNQPHPWTAGTSILDVRTSFTTHDGQSYTPANYDSLEHGPVRVREALASSLNIPAVITLDHIGLDSLFNLASSMGITTLEDPNTYDLSIALGGGEVSLIDLSDAYAVFANGGYRVEPFTILSIEDQKGNVIYSAQPHPKQRVLDERVAWLISDILSDNDARVLGFGPNSLLRLDRPAAVKTGTTSNFHDNWTVGYTPDLVVGVWVGNTDYEPMRDVTGLTGAAPIWHEFMRSAMAGMPQKEFIRPSGLVHVEICSLSGLLPTDACPFRRWEWFISGTQPTQFDTYYKEVAVDVSTGQLANSTTPPERLGKKVVLNLPSPAQPWARAQGLTLLSDLQKMSSSPPDLQNRPTGSASIYISSPVQHSVYRIAPGYLQSAQQLHIEALGEAGLYDVHLWVDGALVTSFTEAPFEAWWPLAGGSHQVWADGLLPTGKRVTSERVSFEVRLDSGN